MTIEITSLILTRNEENKVGKCIESILGSHYPIEKHEIIMVDSNSTDSTIEVAKKYPIKIFKLSEPSIGTALNVALDHSNGAYIFKVDGDSIVPPGFLSKAIDLLKLETDVAIVTGTRKELNKDNLIGKLYEARFEGDKIGVVSNIGGNFVFDKNKIIKAIGRFPDLHCRAEPLACVKANSAGYKVIRINEVSMLHDSSGKTLSLVDYIRKNLSYAFENSIFFRNLTTVEKLRNPEPHVLFIFIAPFMLLSSYYNITFLALFPLIYLGIFLMLLGKRASLGIKTAVQTSLIDSLMFFIRSFAMLYYTFMPLKANKIKAEKVK